MSKQNYTLDEWRAEDSPETIADIIAEMRNDAAEDIAHSPNDINELADRIEAASARERQDAMKTAMMAKCEVCERLNGTGNAAAMREAESGLSPAAPGRALRPFLGDPAAAGLPPSADKADALLQAPTMTAGKDRHSISTRADVNDGAQDKEGGAE